MVTEATRQRIVKEEAAKRGAVGGKANSAAQREARKRNAAAAREARLRKILESQAGSR